MMKKNTKKLNIVGVQYIEPLRNKKSIIIGLIVSLSLLSIILTGCETKVDNNWSGFGDSEHFPAPYENDHSSYLAANNYPISDCQECHGSDYDGGAAGISCIDCHSQNNVPQGCNDCHGDPAGSALNPVDQAPPFDLSGSSNTTVRGVGAHTSHLAGVQFSDGISCSDCHTVPSNDNFLEHLGETPADVVFSGLADNSNHNPVWNPDTEECSNTYCHGDAEPQWTIVNGTEAQCTTCHGLPPGPPHYIATIDDCYECHGSVIDDYGDIINTALHINGAVNGN